MGAYEFGCWATNNPAPWSVYRATPIRFFAKDPQRDQALDAVPAQVREIAGLLT